MKKKTEKKNIFMHFQVKSTFEEHFAPQYRLEILLEKENHAWHQRSQCTLGLNFQTSIHGIIDTK